MELLRAKEPLEFKHGDVTLLIKAEATAADRTEIQLSGRLDERGRVVMISGDWNNALIRCFVVGWRGVTRDGKPVPYAFEDLVNGFPVEGNETLFPDLGAFILKHTNVFKGHELEKKSSPPSPTGS